MATYILLYWAKHSGFYWPVISAYGADLLCLPLVLSISRYALIKLGVVNASFELSTAKIIVATAMFAVVFELILPQWSDAYRADPLDIVAYFLGGILYYIYRLHIVKKRTHEIVCD